MRLLKLMCWALCMLLVASIPARAQSMDYGCLRFYGGFGGPSRFDKYPIALIELTTGQEKPLFRSNAESWLPSPDLKHIAIIENSKIAESEGFDLLIKPLVPDTQPVVVRQNLTYDGEYLFSFDSEWSPNSQWLVYWSQTEDTEALLGIADTAGKELVFRRIELNPGTTLATISWSPDSKYLITAGQNEETHGKTDLVLWTIPDLELLKTFRFSDTPHPSIFWAPDGNHLTLLFGPQEPSTQHLSVLNVENGVHRLITTYLDMVNRMEYGFFLLEWTHDGQYLMYGAIENDEYKLKVYDTKSQTNKELFSSPKPFTYSDAFNSQGYVGIYQEEDLVLHSSYINVRTGEVIQLPDLDRSIGSDSLNMYWKGNNKVFLVRTKDGVAWQHLDANQGYVFKAPISDGAYIVSEDGNYIAVSSSRATWLLDTKIGKEKKLSDSYADHLTFSPDNQALSFIDRVINIYDINGERLSKSEKFLERKESLRHVFWSGDSNYIIMVIRLTETTTSFKEYIALFDKHGNFIRDYTTLPKGAKLQYTDWIPCP